MAIRDLSKPLAIAYIRVSTDDQKLGPIAQKEAIEAYARSKGLAIVAWHSDLGVSGAAPLDERPGLTSALFDARKHKASIIVAKRDRLARDVYLSSLVSRSLPKGAQVLSADGSGNGDAPSDALMRTILDGMAEYERALIRGRTKAALKAKRSRGERAGNVPFGFTADPQGMLSPDPSEQETMFLARTLASSGLSQRAIAARLASLGHLSRKGRPLSQNQVWRLLQPRESGKPALVP